MRPMSGRRVFLTFCILHVSVANEHELAIGVLVPARISQTFIATVVASGLDMLKNFDEDVQAQYGPPIVEIPNISQGLKNITFRIGTSHAQPDMGLATALDFMLGLDGGQPVVGLIGTLLSSVAMPIAVASAGQKVPQIGYGSTSPALSNKDTYPYFLRTVPPDTIGAQAFWSWIIHFEIPKAVCIYSLEPYGEGYFAAIRDLAKAAGQMDRLVGQGIRSMPLNYVFEEARAVTRIVKSLGSRFMFLILNADADKFFSVMEEEGLLGYDWQLVAGNIENAPVGLMQFREVSRGPKFSDFLNLGGDFMFVSCSFDSCSRSIFTTSNKNDPKHVQRFFPLKHLKTISTEESLDPAYSRRCCGQPSTTRVHVGQFQSELGRERHTPLTYCNR